MHQILPPQDAPAEAAEAAKPVASSPSSAQSAGPWLGGGDDRALQWQRQLKRAASSAARALSIKPDTLALECSPAEGGTSAAVLQRLGTHQGAVWGLHATPLPSSSITECSALRLHPPSSGKPALANVLTKLCSESAQLQAEVGVQSLYLCVGFIRPPVGCAVEAPAGGAAKPLPALMPVWLVPVRLQTKAGTPGVGWALSTPEVGTAQLNPAVVDLLQRQSGLQLPSLNGPGVATPTLQWIREALAIDSAWALEDRMMLAHLPWSQAALWQDLQARQSHMRHSPVVAHLLDHPGMVMPTATITGEAEVDLDHLGQWLPTVLDADASQRRVLAAADTGQSWVVHGPPGTGKSQTLVNLMGRAMGRGKRVLFVTEKPEAMAVVHARLTELGLDTWALSLPDASSARHNFFEQIQASLHAAQNASVEALDASDEDDRAEVARAAEDLEALHQALQHRAAAGFTLHEALGAGLHAQWPELAMPGTDPQGHSVGDVERLREITQHMVKQGECFQGQGVALQTHPLRGLSEPRNAAVLQKYQAQAASARTALQSLQVALPDWLCRLGLGTVSPAALPLEAVSRLCRLAACAASAPPGSEALLPHALNRTALPVWRAASRHDRRRDQWLQRLPKALVPDVCLAPAGLLAARWAQANQRWGLARWWGRRRVLRALAGYVRPGHSLTASDVSELLDTLPTLKHDEQRSLQLRAELPWDELLQGDEAACIEWMHQLQEHAAQVRALLDPAIADPQEWDQALLSWLQTFSTPDAQAVLGTVIKACDGAHTAVKSFPGWPADQVENLTLAQLEEGCNVWLDHSALWPAWQRWLGLRQEAIDHGLGGLVDALQDGRLKLEDACAGFEAAYRRWWAQAVQARPPASVARGMRVLRGMGEGDMSPNVQALLDALSEAVSRAQARARQRAYQVAEMNAHAAQLSDSPDAQLGFLNRALQQRRGRPSPRQVIQACAPLLLKLKPVWMMSPLSAAQLLGEGHPGFDMVLIDEASQMPLCRAVGAMSRAPQTLIFGDPQQMPPADYFAARADGFEPMGGGSEDGAGPTLLELDSVLDEALAIGLPQLSLNTHYRSRHECLIAFSNRHFYGGRLNTRPAPEMGRGVMRLVALGDGLYGRGTSRDNPREAQAVVDAITAHLLDPRTASQSLGVVTMNQPQQLLVQRLLDQRCRQNPVLDAALQGLAQAGQPLFVRNLESVQGDERDWVFLSVTYSPMPEAERMALNFGPLNQVGGARRLNVAVSRAREGMVVFSSLRPQDLPREAANAGVRALRTFLEHVQTHARLAAQGPVEMPAVARLSPFETWVKQGLQARGWQVHGPLGLCPAERVDLAVVDPNQPDRYLAALIGDSHSVPEGDVVDREVGRAARLRAMGWQVRPLRLPEFLVNPHVQLEALDAFVRASLPNPTVQDAAFSPQV